ncbi:MAG TPA: hypothetical protein VFT66_23945 [Roseiflexaceae bacterium]|nr:hypothetical protein [Roseiflexaceae bacterium]
MMQDVLQDKDSLSALPNRNKSAQHVLYRRPTPYPAAPTLRLASTSLPNRAATSGA